MNQTESVIDDLQKVCDSASSAYLLAAGHFIDAINMARHISTDAYQTVMQNLRVQKTLDRLKNDIDMHMEVMRHLFKNDTAQPYHDFKTRMDWEIGDLGEATKLVEALAKYPTKQKESSSIWPPMIKSIVYLALIVAVYYFVKG